jgi:hypothetical protein
MTVNSRGERSGQLLECVPAWDGNGSVDGFLAFGWQAPGERDLLVTANYAPNQGQCYVRLPFANLEERSVRFRDMMSLADYDREGHDIASRGLYLDVAPWSFHVFAVE